MKRLLDLVRPEHSQKVKSEMTNALLLLRKTAIKAKES